MDLSAEQIRWILIYLFVLLVSVALHEFGHAFMASKLGDDTPRRQGRVTLNPLAHADPIGTFLLPLIGSVYSAASGVGGGFGWGKPVEWQPHRIDRKWSMSMAKVLVAIAGPSMNILLAAVVATVHSVLAYQHVIDARGEVSAMLYFAVQMNFVLFFFNLLPLPPLDGGHVVQQLVPHRHREAYDSIARFGPLLVIGLMTIPQVRMIFTWPARFLADHLYALLGSIFG